MSKTYQYRTLPVGDLEANCTILMCTKTKEAAIFDAGADAGEIIKAVEAMGANPVKLINTHGHYDHLGAANQLKEKYSIPFYISAKEKEYAEEPGKNLSVMYGESVSVKVEHTFIDGEVLEVGDLKLKVLATPGHTFGGSCFLVDDLLIAGDTIFMQSIGRSDLYGGNAEQLIEMIKTKILTLPEETIIITGHGPQTTVGNEKRMNPFLR